MCADRRLVLASSSPRRRELLEAHGYAFEVSRPDVDERVRAGESPDALVRRLAEEKACAVDAAPDAVVLAADTIVVLDGEVLGKPEGPAHAVEMLLRIAARTHTVWSGFCVRHAERAEVGAVASQVELRAVERDEAEAYAAGGEPLDKAGGYALQGDGGKFVTRVVGSRTNVIGLPMEAVCEALARFGITTP